MILKKWEFELMMLYIVLSLIIAIVFGLYHGFDMGIVTFDVCASLSIITVYGFHYYFEKDKK